MIYIDNAATTYPKPNSVYKAVDECLRNIGGNPGRGGHNLARKAANILYETREELAALFNIDNPTNIVFTYNATDALNTALLGMLAPGDKVVTTAMEHNAVMRPLKHLEARGVNVTIIPCDCEGRLDVLQMTNTIKNGVKAIVMSHASNVTGNIMPIEEIGKLAKQYNSCLIIDAAQTAGCINIDVDSVGIDVLAFSGHKGLLGPQGTGGLYVRSGQNITPARYGGTGSLSELDIQPDFLPDKFESGTPNTPGIAGLLAGVKYIKNVGINNIHAKEQLLAKYLIDGLEQIKGVRLYGSKLNERTAVISFNISSIDSTEVAYYLDREYNIACRGGLHCAPWAHKCIGTLEKGTVRLSPGYFNTLAEMDYVLKSIKEIANKAK